MNLVSAIVPPVLALLLAMQSVHRPPPEPSPAPSGNAGRWKVAKVRPEKRREVERAAARVGAARSRYLAVERRTAVPWHVVGSLHQMECSGSFRHHLHEGSPLAGPTRYVPKGRPPGWNPVTMTWEDSAVDALAYDHMGTKDWRTPGSSLDACEAYNGLGYRRRGLPSPYLWAYTTQEVPGRYIADGVWSSTAMAGQPGVAAVWLAGGWP